MGLTPRDKARESTLFNGNKLLRGVRHDSLSGFNRPSSAQESHKVDRSDDGKASSKADLLCHPSHCDADCNLQESTNEIKGVLYSSHEMFGHLFHEAGVHCDAAQAPCRSHDSVETHGNRQYTGIR